MTLSGLIESLGLGAAGEARSLVERLSGQGLAVVTSEGVVVRALERAGHRAISPGSVPEADAALVLALPEGDEDALALITRLVASVRSGGSLILADEAGRSTERARTAGLCLRAGLAQLRQETVGGTAYTTGKVRSNEA